MSVLSRHAWLAALALMALSGPAHALSQDYFLIDDVYVDEEKWTVAVNVARKSCFMVMEFGDGTAIEVGKDARGGDDEYYMMFANAAWKYEEGRDYGVVVKYNMTSTWEGDAVGMKLNKMRGVTLEGIKKGVIDEFGSMRVMNLRIGGKNRGDYNLATTGKGVTKLEECAGAVADGRISLEEIASRLAENGSAGGTPPPKRDEAAAPPVDESHRGEDTIGGAKNRDPGKSPKDEGGLIATGTGFFINDEGYLLTNAHVVNGCEDAIVRRSNTDVQPAIIVARETTNDLAILKINEKTAAFGKFRGTPKIRLGDSIIMFGYPLAGYLSSTGNLSTGLVASLAGSGDDVTQMQISAPVQSGNSGGAVVDQSGHVVGIVVAKSNTTPYGTGKDGDVEVIQNVNFAIKAGMAQFFLDANQVRYTVEPPGDDLKTPDVAEMARSFSAQVVCEIKK